MAHVPATHQIRRVLCLLPLSAYLNTNSIASQRDLATDSSLLILAVVIFIFVFTYLFTYLYLFYYAVSKFRRRTRGE